MILPIVAYGHPVLRKAGEYLAPDYPNLKELIADMWDTMYASNGVGLAAPQVSRSIRLFVVDTEQIVHNLEEAEKEEYGNDPGLKEVFINARILGTGGKEWAYNEGCLSIPKIREDIYRPATLRIAYVNEHFQPQEREFGGVTARVILHEYDHIEGRLFIDYLKPLQKRLIKNKLDDIAKGKVKVDYRMLFPK